MNRARSMGTYLRRAGLAFLAIAGGLLLPVPPAFADGAPPPSAASRWASLTIAGALFVVVIGGLTLLQWRSTRRRHLQPERERKSGPNAWEEEES